MTTDSKLPPGMRSAREVATAAVDKPHWRRPGGFVMTASASDVITDVAAAIEEDRDAWRQRIAEVEDDNARLRAELAAAREACIDAEKESDEGL